MSNLRNEQRVRREPHETHADEDRGKEGSPRDRRLTGLNKLWNQRREHARDLWIQEIREQTLPEGGIHPSGLGARRRAENFDVPRHASRSARTPSQTRYAAPTSLSAVKAVAEALRSAATPTAAASAHRSNPAFIPTAVSSAARRPDDAVPQDERHVGARQDHDDCGDACETRADLAQRIKC